MFFKLALFIIAVAQLCAALPFPCECTRQLEPVCGSDGETYNNQCIFNCAQAASNNRLNFVKHGACIEETNTGICGCSLDYVPVCGSDGSTYPNTCHVFCKARDVPTLTEAYQGECKYV